MSHSAIETYIQCKYRFYQQWIVGWSLIAPNMNLVGGNLIHAYMTTIHSENTHEIDSAKEIIRGILSNPKNIDPDTRESGTPSLFMALRIVPYWAQGYRKAYKEGKIPAFKGISEFPILKEMDGFDLKARIDLLEPNGNSPLPAKRILDFKYVSDPAHYTFFTTRFQAGIYLYLTGANSITFRCLRKPLLRQGKNEPLVEFLERIRNDVYGRPMFYVKDETYYRGEYKMDRQIAEIGAIAKEIRDNIDNPAFFWQASSKHCLIPWKCDCYAACTSGVWSEQLYERNFIDAEPKGSK